MSFDALLINSCTIWRYAEGVVDAYGVPDRTWAAHITDEPCRISYPKGRQIQRGTEVIPIDALLFIGLVDVTERDRAVVDGVTFEILYVAPPQNGTAVHHYELSLARTKP